MSEEPISEKKRVVGYVRLSQDDDSESLKNQEEEIELECSLNGFNLLKIFNEEYWTGTDRDRPKFKEIWEMVKKGETDIVMVKKLSRIGRDVGYTSDFFKDCEAMQISIYTLDLGIIRDRFTYHILSSVEERQVEMGLSEQRRMMERKKRKGMVFGKAPFGYKNDKEKKTWKLIPAEAETVKKVFELTLAGKHYKEIVKELNLSSIGLYYNIVKNKCYTGIFRHKIIYRGAGQEERRIEYVEYKANNDPIISLELFEKVQKKLSET